MKVPASSAVLCAFVATLCLCQDTADPWPKAAVIEPAALAQILEAGNPPVVISVAFPTLYRAKHIVHAVDAGPTSKPDGIEALKKAVRNRHILWLLSDGKMSQCTASLQDVKRVGIYARAGARHRYQHAHGLV
jgi:hypothetical protein